jgi:hypothetical protein
LEALPDATVARNVILDDATVIRFVNAAYARDQKLGLLVDTLAVTGGRPSQVSRLLCEDLHGALALLVLGLAFSRIEESKTWMPGQGRHDKPVGSNRWHHSAYSP